AVHWLSLLPIEPRLAPLAASTISVPSVQLTMSMPASSMTVPGCSPSLACAESQMTSLPLARSSSRTSSSSLSAPLPLDFRTTTESSPRLTGPTPSCVHTFFGFVGGIVDENGSLGVLVADFDGCVRAGRNVHVDIAVFAAEGVERFEVTGLSVHRRDAAPAGRLRSHEE